MNKQQLVNEAAQETGIVRAEVWLIFEAMLAKIAHTIQHGEDVRLSGFGVFYKGGRKQSSGRHPRTGEPMEVGPVVRPKFRAGPVLRQSVNKTVSPSA